MPTIQDTILPRIRSVRSKLVDLGRKLKRAVTPTPMDYSPENPLSPTDLSEDIGRQAREHSVPLGEVNARLINQRPMEFDLGDGVPRRRKFNTVESAIESREGDPLLLTVHSPPPLERGTREYLDEFIDLDDATALFRAAKNVGALDLYGDAAHARDPTTVDRNRGELLDILHLIVRPFTCLTESTNQYGVQYKQMGKDLNIQLRSAINNLTTFANNCSDRETWYKENLISQKVADAAVERFPLDLTVNARIPHQRNYMSFEAFLSLPGVPNVVDKCVGDLVSAAFEHNLDLATLRLERNNTLTHHWNGGLNLRGLFSDNVKGTFNDAEYGPDMNSCQTAMQNLDRFGWNEYLVEQAIDRYADIVQTGIVETPTADFVLRALRHSVVRLPPSQDIQDFSLFFSRLRLIAARNDTAALHPKLFPMIHLDGELSSLNSFASTSTLSPAHSALINISHRIRSETSHLLHQIWSHANFSPSVLEEIAEAADQAQMSGKPYSPAAARQTSSGDSITTRLFAITGSVMGAATEQDIQYAAEVRLKVEELAAEYETRARGASREPLSPPPERCTTVEGGIRAIKNLLEEFVNDPKTEKRLKMAFRVVRELQGGPKEGKFRDYNTFSLELAMSDKSRATARAFKNFNLLGTSLGLEYIQKTLLFLALALVFPDLNALVTLEDAVFQDLYDRGCAINNTNRIVGSEILKDVHGATIALGCYSTKGLRKPSPSNLPEDIKKAVGQIDPRWYEFLIKVQGGACMMHELCERSLVYDPTQRPLHKISERAIAMGCTEARNVLATLGLDDKLPRYSSYPCLYQLLQYAFHPAIACLIPYFAYLFHWIDKFARGKGLLPAGAIGSEGVVTLSQMLMDQENIAVVGSRPGAEKEEDVGEEAEEGMDISR